jgi:hypothetical protein
VFAILLFAGLSLMIWIVFTDLDEAFNDVNRRLDYVDEISLDSIDRHTDIKNDIDQLPRSKGLYPNL